MKLNQFDSNIDLRRSLAHNRIQYVSIVGHFILWAKYYISIAWLKGMQALFI